MWACSQLIPGSPNGEPVPWAAQCPRKPGSTGACLAKSPAPKLPHSCLPGLTSRGRAARCPAWGPPRAAVVWQHIRPAGSEPRHVWSHLWARLPPHLLLCWTCKQNGHLATESLDSSASSRLLLETPARKHTGTAPAAWQRATAKQQGVQPKEVQALPSAQQAFWREPYSSWARKCPGTLSFLPETAQLHLVFWTGCGLAQKVIIIALNFPRRKGIFLFMAR